MTSHLDSHTTTDVNRKCIQVSKPDMAFHMINMVYQALPMSAHRKDDIFMKRQLLQSFTYIGLEAWDFYIDEAHTALNLFHFVVFLFFCKLRRDLKEILKKIPKIINNRLKTTTR